MRRALPTARVIWTALAATLLLAATGCSVLADSDAIDIDDPKVKAAIDQAEDLGIGGESMVTSREEEECVESHPDLGQLDIEAILGDASATAQRVMLFEILFDCIEDPASSPGLVASITRTLSAVAPSADFSEAESRCVIRFLVDNADDPALVMVGGGGESDAMLFFDAAETCLTPENYGIITGAEGTGPQAYGDDPRLDRLWDECGDGDMRTCDLLYLQSSIGSDYEEHGETCGGTDLDVSTYCSEDVDVDESGFLVEDGPAGQVLVRDCETGDLTACDLIYQIAPFGSDLENIGYTCGGQIAVGAIPDCRTRLG